jgi:hypothetical protein
MSRSSKLGAVLYNVEAAWGEDLTTFGTRLPVLTQVDVSGLSHEKMAPDRVVQYRNDDTMHIPMLMGGSFKTKLYLTGHGSATSGATTISALETFLGYVFGSAVVGAATGTTASGGTATVPTVAAATGFSNGTICRIGALGDGRGNGQFYGINSHAASALNLLTGMAIAPNNGDVVYSAGIVYPQELPSSNTMSGLRMLLQTANLEYEVHGCYPMSVTITGYNTGEVPAIEVDWGVSWWRYSTATFPSAVAVDEHTPAACAAGSVFINTVVGSTPTVARVTRSIRSMTINWTLGVQTLMGVGGVNQYQGIVGAVRVPDDIRVTLLEDSEAATATPALDGFWDSTSKYHMLCTLNPQATKAMAIYFRKLVVVGQRPQQRDDGGINRVAIELKAVTGPNTTNDLTAAAAILAFA